MRLSPLWSLALPLLLSQKLAAQVELVESDGAPAVGVLVRLSSGAELLSDERGRVDLGGCVDSFRVSSAFYETATFPCRQAAGAKLTLRTRSLSEVRVTAARADAGQYLVSAEYIKNSPALLGEPDVLRALQSLPGISGGSEGQVAPLVRGGSADQTLILLDDALLFSPSHAIGFLGAINADVARSADVYMGNFPARYGNRLSGIVSVRSREGARDGHHRTFGIGFPNATATLEGPLRKGSYLVSGRASFPTLFMVAAESRLMQGDLFAKVTLPVREKGQVTVSTFVNRDRWGTVDKFADDEGGELTNRAFLMWGNRVHAVRYTGSLGRATQTTALTYSNYFGGGRVVNVGETYKERFDMASASRDAVSLSTRVRGTFAATPLTYEASAQYQYAFNRIRGIGTAGEAPAVVNEPSDKGHQANVGIDLEYTVARRLRLKAGSRLLGLSAEFLKPTLYLEPRASATYLAGAWNYTLAYDRMTQTVHSFAAGGDDGYYQLFLPPSDDYPAARSRQVALSADYIKPSSKFQFRGSAYAKEMTGTVFVPDGRLLNPSLRNASTLAFRQNGRAYGVEAFASYRPQAATSASVAYAYARSFRKDVDRVGTGYVPFRWDRPHNLNVTFQHSFSDRWRANALFTYQSGYRYAVPDYVVAQSYFAEYYRPVFTQRYTARSPDAHRVDLSFVHTRHGERGTHEWILSLYNVYGRKNPFATYYDRKFGPVDRSTGGPIEGTYTPYIRVYSLLQFVPGVMYKVSL